MSIYVRRVLCAVRLCLMAPFLRPVPTIIAAEVQSGADVTGSYLCVEIPETPNQWVGSRTLEIQKDGATAYFMFPTAVVTRSGQPHPLFATGTGSWHVLSGDARDYSLCIITATEMSTARRRTRDGTDLLEIEHPSTAGPFITRWKRIGEASEPFVPKRKNEDQTRKVATDAASNSIDEMRLLRGQVQMGYAAFCRYERKIDELQVIGEVRTLDEDERNVLSELLTAEGSWYLRTPDQQLRGSRNFSLDPDDFKIVLAGKETVFVLRISSGSRQVRAMLNGKIVALPNLRNFAFEELRTYFDRWFPHWEEITQKNYRDWLGEIHRRDHHEGPNKAPEPTPGTVTPRAKE